MEKEFLRRLDMFKGNITLLISRLHYSIHLYSHCHERFGGCYIKMLNKHKELLNLAIQYEKG
jgi:hypothetical protein